MQNKFPATRVVYLLAANVLIVATVAFAAVLEAQFPDLYYKSVQEDEYIEWASFWAFMLAAIAAVISSRKYRNGTNRFPWFFYGLALFCFLIAMEEISWGQRVLGYRPPTYFLEHNFQQELNIHNVIDTDYRKLVLSLAIIGYGVLLPLLGLFGPLRSLLERLGVISPNIGLVPAFAATFLLYQVYPFGHSGEWVELMLGTGLLFSVLPDKPGAVLAAWAAILLLGLVGAAATRMQRDEHPATMAAAQAEIEAIKRDFESGRVDSNCSLHKRLYSFVVKYKQYGLQKGEFASLTSQGLPEERAEFLLDPWNSPYWIRDRCNRKTQTRVLFVYSFGPNRRRDSSEAEIRGDDVGVYISPP